ncbi:hypothetical protein QNH20_24710 [Neobacillus sp. WH10]|uniref:hypothetical protein n=1 Tax=Neobacillus sp. WH10 TaxID=3047873 RepID=UPI0024C18246|nr:hypothetical protein [Neobacillus sp. WH10]WHY77238.1 hypothetical protein QNH20_24710 [Neobacillus sp. WH10]
MNEEYDREEIGNQLRDTLKLVSIFLFAPSSVLEESGSAVPLNQVLIQYAKADKGLQQLTEAGWGLV